MSKEKYFIKLEFIIQNDEMISAVFRKICKNYNLKGKIQDKLAISTIPQNSRNHLRTIFNSESVKSGYVDIKLFFESIRYNGKQQKEWLNRIFEITGIEKKTKQEEETEKRNHKRLLLNKLELNFPDLSETIDYLIKNNLLEKTKEIVLFDALNIFSFIIANDKIINFSELGAKELKDSKAIREGTELFNLVYGLLLHYLQSNELKNVFLNAKDLFEYYNVISNATAIKVTLFGPFIYYKNGIKFDFIKKLWEIGESAILSMDNLKNIDSIEIDEGFELLTCENESPFNLLIRENKKFALIFTSGFPNSAVKKILELLKDKKKKVLHWGDSDFNGLYIASIINNIIPVNLWRCDLETLKRKKRKLIRIEDSEKLYRMEQFVIKNQDFPFRNELLFTIKNGWLEQENY